MPHRTLTHFSRARGNTIQAVSDEVPRTPDEAREWSEAQLELATLAFNEWNLAEVIARTSAILQLDPSWPIPEARRHAALMLNQARDNNDEPVDEDQVRSARAELESADEHYAAAQASSLLATVAAQRGDRDAARRELDRAETRYTLAGSMYGVPNCEYRRARLCIDDGDDARARAPASRAPPRIATAAGPREREGARTPPREAGPGAHGPARRPIISSTCEIAGNFATDLR